MTERLAAFQKMNKTLESLKGAAGKLPPASSGLGLQLDGLRAEGLARHDLMILNLQLEDTAAQDQTRNLQEGSALARKELGSYRQARVDGTQAAVRQVEAVQMEFESFGDLTLVQGLVEQRQALESWEAAERQADGQRQELVQASATLLRHQGDTSGDVLAEFDRAAGAMQQGLETEGRRLSQCSAAAALALSREGMAAYHGGNYPLAAQLIQQAAAGAPDGWRARLLANLCLIFLETGQSAEARQALEQASALNSGSFEVLYAGGMLALRTGQPGAAAAYLEQALASAGGGAGINDANIATCRLSLAEAYRQAGDPTRAIEQWQRVLILEPGQPAAQAWLAALGG